MADTNLTPIMLSDLAGPVQELRRFGVMFRGLLALAEKTEQLGQLFGTEQEHQARLADLKRQADAVRAVVAAADAAQRRLDDINAELAQHQANMAQERARTIEAAHAEAKNIHAAGRTTAEEMLAEARGTAATEAERHAAEIATRQTTIAGLDAKIATRRAELDGIKHGIAELRAKIGAG
jgi:chromosome segregation ATPase